MDAFTREDDLQFLEAVRGLLAGDFSRLEPLFEARSATDDTSCTVLDWHRQGRFRDQPRALAEAFTCACFLGRGSIVGHLLDHGVVPSGGSGTGLDGFHWAANRGQLDTVKLLIRHKAPLETRSMYGATVLGTAAWSALNEPRPDHLPIIEALLDAGARIDADLYPSGDERIDQLLRQRGAGE